MKMFKLFSIFSILLMFISCGEKEDRTVEMEDTANTEMEFQDPNEAIENWIIAWNSNDPAQVKTQTADDVVLVLDGQEMPKDSIGGFFEVGSIMKDLETKSLKKGSTETIAYDTGTYTHTYTTDSTQQFQGSYTVIWERTTGENEWKVKAINISNQHPEDN